MFGGYNTSDMKRKLGIKENRPLADFLPTITITAKQLATEITNFNVKKNNLNGEANITVEHVKNNQDVRALLGKNDIKPEDLPVEEDIKNVCFTMTGDIIKFDKFQDEQNKSECKIYPKSVVINGEKIPEFTFVYLIEPLRRQDTAK